jgi:MoaF C-terminal domain/MoaF N-terminal domain
MSDPARWISVGELAEAFDPDNYTPPPTGDLAGATHALHFEDGRTVEYRFVSDSRLRWKAMGAGNAAAAGVAGARTAGAAEGEAEYFALKPREGIYFVDYLAGQAPPTAVSLVLDLKQGIATSLVARLPESSDVGESLTARAARGEELTAVAADFSSAAVGTAYTVSTPRHLPTTDLVGRRVEYTYSATERYEHIYLNEHFYTWHCLLGSERGLADTDRCHYLKLGDDLYLFVWREKIIPTLGAVVVDFRAMRTMGKIFGHAQGAGGRSDSSGVVDFRVGARARVLNLTSHGKEISA